MNDIKKKRNENRVKKSKEALKRLNDFSYLDKRQDKNRAKNEKFRQEEEREREPCVGWKMSESDCKMGWGHTGPCVTANCTCANNNANKLGVSNELQSLRDELAKLKEENERLRESVKIHEGCYADLQDACDEANRLHCERTKERDQALSELAAYKKLKEAFDLYRNECTCLDNCEAYQEIFSKANDELDAAQRK